MSKISKVWFLAVRPQSLVASACPVIVATAMAFGDGIWHPKTAFLCLLGAIVIHLITNLTNEYCDYKNGVDQEKFLGTTGFTQADLIKSGAMLAAITVLTILAALISFILVLRGGMPIALIALTSIPAAILYTAGKNPLGYRGWGDVMVLLFFGPVATAGTYYVQSFEINSAVILAGIAPGLLSAGVLIVNNIRDVDNDRTSNKRTLVVKFGETFGYYEYFFSIIAASLVPVLIYAFIQDHLPILICSVISIIQIPNMVTLLTKKDRDSYNRVLASTGRLLVIYSAVFSITWNIL